MLKQKVRSTIPCQFSNKYILPTNWTNWTNRRATRTTSSGFSIPRASMLSIGAFAVVRLTVSKTESGWRIGQVLVDPQIIVLGYAILLLLLTPSSSSTSLSKRGVIQLCGRRLAEALNMLCQGEYYDPEEEDNNISKKNLESGLRDDFYSGRLLGLPTSRINDSHYYQQLQLYSRRRRQQGGVVDECCRQACPLSVLLSYCRNGK